MSTTQENWRAIFWQRRYAKKLWCHGEDGGSKSGKFMKHKESKVIYLDVNKENSYFKTICQVLN